MIQQPLVDQDLLIIEVSRSYSDTSHRQDFSGRVVSPTQGNLPDNTQRSQQTDIHAAGTFESAISESVRPQTHALNLVDTGIGIQNNIALLKIFCF